MGNYDPHMGSFLSKIFSFLGFLFFIFTIVSLFKGQFLTSLLLLILSFVFMYLARTAAIWRLNRIVRREFKDFSKGEKG